MIKIVQNFCYFSIHINLHLAATACDLNSYKKVVYLVALKTSLAMLKAFKVRGKPI